MCEDKYSVVVLKIETITSKLLYSFTEIFGRRHFDIGSLVKTEAQPSEVVADVPFDEASRIAERLQEFDVETVVLPTPDVTDVKHRAHEFWPDRTGEHFGFVEEGGMIFLPPSLNGRKNLARMQAGENILASWRFESVPNHAHFFIDWHGPTVRDMIRNAYEHIKKLTEDLTSVYPDKSFMIYYDMPDRVGFYQVTDDSPTETITAEERKQDTAWCYTCKKKQPYWARIKPDKEFPEAIWGECQVCDDRILVSGPFIRTRIGPSNQEHD